MRNLNNHSNYGILDHVYANLRNLNCVIQIMHRDVNLRTDGLKYCHSNCAIQIIQIVNFCSRVKTVILKVNHTTVNSA